MVFPDEIPNDTTPTFPWRVKLPTTSLNFSNSSCQIHKRFQVLKTTGHPAVAAISASISSMHRHCCLVNRNSICPVKSPLLSIKVLPPLVVPEENPWSKWRRLLQPDFLPVTQPTLSEHWRKNQSTDHDHGTSSTGLMLYSSTIGMLREGELLLYLGTLTFISNYYSHDIFLLQGVQQISRYDFQETFWPKWSTLCSFFEAVSKLYEQACSNRPHPTPITRSTGELADTYRDY